MLISESFDARTLANMEVALERACRSVPTADSHAARRQIANEILERAKGGDRRLSSLTGAARAAARNISGNKRA